MVVNAPTSNIVQRRRARGRPAPRRARATSRPPTPRSRTASGSARSTPASSSSDKTVGIVGLGRIGVLVAQRLQRVRRPAHRLRPVRASRLAPRRSASAGDSRRAAGRERLHHGPPAQDPETLGLIGDEALHKVKPTVRLINAARGGIVDEDALARAIAEGRVAGAGIDVFAKEPCTDSPLFELEQVVVTPHLGASTDEAQEKAGIAGRAVRTPGSRRRAGAGRRQRPGRRHRRGRTPGPAAHREARPDLHRAGRASCRPRSTVEVRGEIADAGRHGARALRAQGRCSPMSSRTPCPTSTPRCSRKERGVEVVTRHHVLRAPTTATSSPSAASLATGGTVSVSGTLLGAQRRSRRSSRSTATTSTWRPAEHMAFFRYADRPGVVGIVGRILGDAGDQHRGDAGGPRRPRAARRSSRSPSTRRSTPRRWRPSLPRSAPSRSAPSTSSTEPFGHGSATRWAERSAADTVVRCWQRHGGIRAPRQRSIAAARKAGP